MKIILDCDKKRTEYEEDNFHLKEGDYTWSELLVKFVAILGTHGYYVPEGKDIAQAVEKIQKEKFEALFENN